MVEGAALKQGSGRGCALPGPTFVHAMGVRRSRMENVRAILEIAPQASPDQFGLQFRV